uniref:SH3 domain-containing protein n=1 Tax=Setaria digitata TaxID=48799 RepID=A0A915PMX3_9BILA
MKLINRISGTFGNGKFSVAFSTAKSVFDIVKRPEVQRGLIEASKNNAIRSTVSSLAKNEEARKAAHSALQDERTLKAGCQIAPDYDRRQQQKNLKNLDAVPYGTFLTCFATSEFEKKKKTPLYPTLPSSRDYAPDTIPKTTTNSITTSTQQLVTSNTFQSDFSGKKIPLQQLSAKQHHNAATKMNTFTDMDQEVQPHGYAKFQFLASHFDELSAEPFDRIILEKKVDDQWVYALNKRTGAKGIIPLLYIDVKIPLPPSTFQMPFYVRALFDFDSNVAGDLTFRTNDEIFVTERINNDWLRGSIGKRQGIFPNNYVQEITTPTTINASESRSCVVSPEYITALYDYNSAVEEDLIFKAGDKIEVLEWVSEDWLRGRLNGKIGLVPRTYISYCNSNGTAKQLDTANTIVTATRDYYNVAEDYLCFSKGDRIEVTEKVNDEWLRGKLLLNMSNTKSFPVGLFPRSAVL